jgi:hypothetical protein
MSDNLSKAEQAKRFQFAWAGGGAKKVGSFDSPHRSDRGDIEL